MKANSIHPHISEFDRIDHLPTFAEFVESVRQCVRSVLDSVSLIWR
jgi:hypothetical protein